MGSSNPCDLNCKAFLLLWCGLALVPDNSGACLSTPNKSTSTELAAYDKATAILLHCGRISITYWVILFKSNRNLNHHISHEWHYSCIHVHGVLPWIRSALRHVRNEEQHLESQCKRANRDEWNRLWMSKSEWITENEWKMMRVGWLICSRVIDVWAIGHCEAKCTYVICFKMIIINKIENDEMAQ